MTMTKLQSGPTGMIFYDSREGSFMVNQMISGLLISSVGGDRRGFSQEHGAAESYLSRVIYCGMIGTLFAIRFASPPGTGWYPFDWTHAR